MPANRNMGIGNLGNSKLVFKRKFRWTFSVRTNCKKMGGGEIPEYFVKVAARPSLTIEETEINFLNAKMFIPGKGTWETMTVTYLDVAGKLEEGSGRPNEALWGWLASVYDFTDPDKMSQGSKIGDYSATGTLVLWDGCGQAIETWTLYDMWPTAINFGDLDMGSSDVAEIELTLRYRNVKYENHCPGYDIKGCCTPCGS